MTSLPRLVTLDTDAESEGQRGLDPRVAGSNAKGGAGQRHRAGLKNEAECFYAPRDSVEDVDCWRCAPRRAFRGTILKSIFDVLAKSGHTAARTKMKCLSIFILKVTGLGEMPPYLRSRSDRALRGPCSYLPARASLFFFITLQPRVE